MNVRTHFGLLGSFWIKRSNCRCFTRGFWLDSIWNFVLLTWFVGAFYNRSKPLPVMVSNRNHTNIISINCMPFDSPKHSTHPNVLKNATHNVLSNHKSNIQHSLCSSNVFHYFPAFQVQIWCLRIVWICSKFLQVAATYLRSITWQAYQGPPTMSRD